MKFHPHSSTDSCLKGPPCFLKGHGARTLRMGVRAMALIVLFLILFVSAGNTPSLSYGGSGSDHTGESGSNPILSPQDRTRGVLAGTVKDASTGEFLYFANVFLANTLKGAATDKKGHFRIENVQPGKYDLVASMIGYELQSRPVVVAEASEAAFHFSLVPKVIQGEKLTVTAEYPRGWKRQLKVFLKYFLGKTRNALYCTLTNPEVLNFNDDQEKRIFTAQANEPIIVENGALGYRQIFYLLDFSVREDRFSSYQGIMRFEEMAAQDQAESDRREKNRLRTYLGSWRHFLIALAEGRAEEEGFSVSNVQAEYFQTRNGTEYYIPGKSGSGSSFKQRVIAPLVKKDGQYVFIRGDSLIHVLNQTGLANEFSLSFPDMMEIRYKDDTSWIELMGENAIVYLPWGLIENPYSVQVSGRWSDEGTADWLPLEYRPDSRRMEEEEQK